jgi:hypothetical protein
MHDFPINGFSTDAWMDGTLSLLKDSPLESVQLNTFNGYGRTLGDMFCMRIVDQHRDHLVRFSLHGLRLALPSIDHICLQCAKLENLFICVSLADITVLVCFLFFFSNLQ